MAINRYTQLTPTAYNPRSLQETLYLPMLQREREDKINEQAAVTRSQLDQLKGLDDIHGKREAEIKDGLNREMDLLTEKLARQGVNSTSKADFMNVASNFSKQVGEAGDLNKMNQIREKYQADREKIIAYAQEQGHNPEETLARLDEAYQKETENYDVNKLDFINLPNSPEYYDVSNFLNDYKGQVEQTVYNDVIKSGDLYVDQGVVKIRDHTKTSANNLEQLKQLRNLAQETFFGKGGKGRLSADWNNKSDEQLTRELNAAMGMKAKISEIDDVSTKVDLSALKPSGGSRGPKNNDEIVNYNNPLGSQSLKLKNKEDLNNRIDKLDKEYQTALNNNNKEEADKLYHDIRLFQNIKKEKVDTKLAEFNQDLTKIKDNIVLNNTDNQKQATWANQFLERRENNYDESIYPQTFSLKRSLNKETHNTYDYYIQREWKDMNSKKDDKRKFDKILINKDLYKKLQAYDKVKENLQNDYEEDINASLKTEVINGTSIMPQYKNQNNKNFAQNESLDMLATNNVKIENRTIRDSNGEVIDINIEELGNEKLNDNEINEQFLNYIGTNKDQFNISKFEVARIGKNTGYRIVVNPKEDYTLEDEWLNTVVEKGGSIEVFVPLRLQDLQDNNSTSYFYQNHLNTDNKKKALRGIKYGTTIPTVNSNELGKNYNYKSSRFINNYKDNEIVDFLQTSKGIELHKVNTKQPGNSLGKIKVKDIYDKIQNWDVDTNPELEEKYNIEVENLVYYRGETHYFVTTATRKCLANRNIVKDNIADVNQYLSKHNVDKNQLELLARDLALHVGLENPEFAKKGSGTAADVQIFDFSSKHMATEPWQVISDGKSEILVGLVGDALIEPFWPLGTGANRAVLGALDLVYFVYKFIVEKEDLENLQRSALKFFKVLNSSSPNDLNPFSNDTSIDPTTRYKKNLRFG